MNDIRTLTMKMVASIDILNESIKDMAANYKRMIAERDATIAALQERIAHLEEANAGMCETRPITQEEWKENFR